MKRFEFRLERVLEWRRVQLDAELAEAGRLMAQARAVEKQRDQVAAECARAERALLSATTIEARELVALDGFRAWSRREIQRLETERAAWKTKIAAQRERVLEARRRLRLLERLRANRLAEWETEWNREMENLAGELHLARVARAQRSAG